MKKVLIFAFAMLLCTSCAAKKKVVQEQPQPVQQSSLSKQQAYLDSLKMAQEIKRVELQMQAEEAALKAEIAANQVKLDNAVLATRKVLGQRLDIPCVNESFDKHGEYMAGLGIAQGEQEINPGIANANRAAIADITTRYIGMIKNGVSQYSKNVNTRSGGKIKENELEGAAEAIGTKLIDKYAETVCRDYEQDDFGGFTCYVAVHVPLKEVVNATVDELGVIQTDFDRDQFRKYMNAELDKQAAAKEAEKKELMEQRQMLEQK